MALLLLIQELRNDELRRTTFIGRGLDGVAVIETATKKEKAAAEHATTFVQPPEEIEAKKQLDGEIKAARREFRY